MCGFYIYGGNRADKGLLPNKYIYGGHFVCEDLIEEKKSRKKWDAFTQRDGARGDSSEKD